MLTRASKILFVLLIGASFRASGATIASITDGPWTDPNTWDCTCVPNMSGWPYDDVTVNHVVTKAAGGLIVLGGADLVVNGTLNISASNFRSGNWGGSTVTVNGGGTINVAAGNYLMTGDDGLVNNGTITAVNFSTSGGAPCGGCGITNNGTMTLSGNFTHNVNRVMNMTNGTLNVGGNLQVGPTGATLNAVNSNINVTNDLNVSGSGVFNHSSGNLSVGGDFNNTGAVGVVFGAAVDITGDVNNTGSSNMTFSSASTVGGNVTGTGATSIIIDGSLDVTGGISISGSAQLSGTGVVGFGSFTTDNSGSKMNCATGDKHDTDGGSADPPPPHNPMDLSTCGPGVILPVELLFINATDQGDHNVITWATVTEENNASFTVLRSDDGEHFYAIGQVAGAGNSQVLVNYSFIDNNHTSAYYQLLQTDFDGQTAYSDIVFVNIETGLISVYPNPSTGGELNISFGRSIDNIVGYVVYDIAGHELFNETSYLEGNLHTIYFSNSLATGVYILSIEVESKVEHFRIVIR